MLLPTAQNFERIRGRFFQGESLRNPYWLKYDWWIYTEANALESLAESRAGGRRLRDPREKLSTFDAMLMARDLDDRFETYFLLNWSRKRDDRNAPWDIAMVRRNGGGIAPSFADDPDRPWRGHK